MGIRTSEVIAKTRHSCAQGPLALGLGDHYL